MYATAQEHTVNEAVVLSHNVKDKAKVKISAATVQQVNAR